MQQERLRALGQMASGIAHDINNAISPIALYTESLLRREPGLSARGRDQLQTIAARDRRRGRHGRAHARILSPARSAVALVPMDFNGLVQQVVDLTRARWSDMPQQRGIAIRVRTDLAQDLPQVLGVEGEIPRSADQPVCSTRWMRCREGGVLTLRTRDRVDGRGAQLEVADTGTGMDEDTRRRCLEPFSRPRASVGRDWAWRWCTATVQRHGADIEIQQRAGARHGVCLRFAIGEGATAYRRKLRRQVPGPHAHPVVDDDPIVLRRCKHARD